MTMLLASLAVAAAGTGMAVPDNSPQEAKGHHAVPVPSGPDPVYPADFYASFQPQTALDMLERTPGFTLSSGTSVRGFGGAAGNVLIDGQRPTVKAGGISEVLRRIPAARVERIVLLRGSDAAEAQGQTLVANVILKADAGGAGNATMTLTRAPDGHIAPGGKVSYAKALGDWQTSIELMAETARYPSSARFRNSDTDGVATLSRVQTAMGKAPEYGMAASASRALAGGTLTANLRLNHDIFESTTNDDLYAGEIVGTPYGVRTVAYREKGSSGELGLDWTRGLGAGWTTKLVGLGRIETFRTTEDYQEPGYRGVSDQREKPMELVARATVAREGNHAVRPELGVEIAYNRLNSSLDYEEDTGAGLMPVALSNANTRVSELRGEAFANVTVRLATRLDLEAGSAFELSRIRARGDVASEQSLSYVKPSAALVWSPWEKTQLRLGARRTVDQLDFSDFAASVDQADGRPLGGNSGLRPARITRALLRVDHRWGKGGALTVEAFHQWYGGLLGYLILDSGDEALGTIGNARLWGITASGSLPLDAILPGARLTFDGTLRDSRLRDPVTGGNRAMDGIAPRSLSAEFRHDLPALRSSWGLTFAAAETERYFYTGELLALRTAATFGAYVETGLIPGFKTTLKASAISGEGSHRLRRFYSPTRAGDYTGSEERVLRSGAVVSLTVARVL